MPPPHSRDDVASSQGGIRTLTPGGAPPSEGGVSSFHHLADEQNARQESNLPLLLCRQPPEPLDHGHLNSGAYGCRSRTFALTGHCAAPLHQCTFTDSLDGWTRTSALRLPTPADCQAFPHPETKKGQASHKTPGLGSVLLPSRCHNRSGRTGNRPTESTGQPQPWGSPKAVMVFSQLRTSGFPA